MNQSGANLVVQIQPVQNGYGENTVVWSVLNPVSAPRGASTAADATTHVTVSNVLVNGTAQQFSYDVIAFDPSVTSAPAISNGGVVSAADYQGNSVSPGEILAVFGTGLGPSNLIPLGLDSNNLLLTKLGPTRVLFDGQPSPMVYTLDKQVSAIAPFSIAGKATVGVQVEFNGVTSNAITLPVVATKPAIFTTDKSGAGQGAILNQDFSVNGAASPAAKGSVVQIFMTGGGALDKPGPDGSLASGNPLQNLAAAPKVKIGGIDAIVQFAGAAPSLVLGVVQVNAFVPASVSSGNASLEVNVGGVSSQPGVTVAVR